MKRIAFFATQETASYVRSFEAQTATIRRLPQKYDAEFVGTFFLEQMDSFSPDEWTDFFEQARTLDIIIGFMSPMLLVHLFDGSELSIHLMVRQQKGQLTLIPLPILPCRWREDANPFQRCYPLADDPINKRRDDGLYEAAGALGKWLEEEAKPASPRPILQQSTPVWVPPTPQPLPAQFPKVAPRPRPSPVFAQPAAVSCSPGSTILLVFAERDRPFAELLERHFRASKISVQYSGDVAAGSVRLDEYRKHVQHAKVILILESADCYADSVCEAYLDLVQQYGNVVRVVKCRPLACSFSYQSVNNRPLSQVSDKEAVVQQIVQDVAGLL